MTELETARLRLRLWRDEDVEHLHRLNTDPEFVRWLTPGGRPHTRAETEAQLARFRGDWEAHRFGIWAVEELGSGRFVGRIGVRYHRLWPDDPELGWGLDPAVWGRGYATEGGRAALRHAFETLPVERLVSIVLPENAPSIRVMDRLGFSQWREVPWPDGGATLEVRALGRDEWARLQSPG